MSWIQNLYETYERCAGHEAPGEKPLAPICHTTQKAHVEIVLDEKGDFRRAEVVPSESAETLIPGTIFIRKIRKETDQPPPRRQASVCGRRLCRPRRNGH